MYHKENTNPQVRKVVIGVCEYLGGEIVMEFDNTDAAKPCDFAPPQTTRRLACGVNRLQTLEEWGFPTQPNRPSKAKNTLGRLSRSIKGDVKTNTSAAAGSREDFCLGIQPTYGSEALGFFFCRFTLL